MEYIGEHLLFGNIGKLFIFIGLIAVVASLAFSIGNIKKIRSERNLKWARTLYLIHVFSILAVVVMLFLIIVGHYYEYHYVWRYSSNEMPMKYMVSALWAGQEGSYMIWMLMQAVMGLFILKKFKDWEPGLITAIGLSQAFLLLLVSGVDFLGLQIGVSPFELIRTLPENLDNPFFQNPQYLSDPQLADGNGLNPLLENPWMVIHPPVLFLGYSAALIPFGIAFTAFIKREYHLWIKKSLPWLLTAVLILGTGILLGGAWAYESLSFGGFWAWDPVENASLMPWMVLIIALHFTLIANTKKQWINASLIFTLFSYVLVVYASFLTRSGLLGDTSVHSFGDNPVTWLLSVFMVVFTVVPLLVILLNRYKKKEELKEEVLSREFLMFIGLIVFSLAGLLIFLATSIPVFNSIFGTDIAPPADRVEFYNKWETPYAILIALLISLSQFFIYGKNDFKKISKRLIISLGISLVLGWLIFAFSNIDKLIYIILLFAVVFTIVTSVTQVISLKVRIKNAGSFISHFGFGVFLLGVVLAFSQSQVISNNSAQGMMGTGNEKGNQFLILGDIQPMGDYFVSYSKREVDGNKVYYQLDFLKQREDGQYILKFSLKPSVNINLKFGNVYDPDTRHYLKQDVFTFIRFANLAGVEQEQYKEVDKIKVMEKDTLLITETQKMILDSITEWPFDNYNLVTGYFRSINEDGSVIKQELVVRSEGGECRPGSTLDINDGSYRFTPMFYHSEEKTFDFVVSERMVDFVIVKAIVFPYISALWLGALIMSGGLFIAIVRRVRMRRQKNGE